MKLICSWFLILIAFAAYDIITDDWDKYVTNYKDKKQHFNKKDKG